MVHPQSPLVLTLDIGSSSVRCSAYDAMASLLPGSLVQRDFHLNPDGTASLASLVQLAEQVVDGCLGHLRAQGLAHDLAGAGIDSFAMSWLGVDADGQPCTPVLTYADNSSADYGKQLARDLTARSQVEAIYQRTGVPIHSAYAPAQLLRLAATAPHLLQPVAYWQTVASHLLARWTGQPFAPISSSEAGWTGMLDRHRLDWDWELVERLPINPHQLPPIRDYATPLSGLAVPWAQRWPELQSLPFFLAVGDGVAANIGSSCVEPQRIAVTIGTSGALRIIVDQVDGAPAVPAGLWAYRVDHRRHLVGGALTDGGSLYAWLRRTLQTASEDDLQAEISRMEPDSHRLTVLPFLHSERSPGWAHDARLTIDGLSAGTTPAHIVRAGLEAVALRFGLIAERLEPLLPPQAAVYASGGALQSSATWRQILADVLNRPVHLIAVPEATSRGTSLLVLEALGLPPADPTAVEIRHTAVPHPQAHAVYRQASRRQQELYQRVLAGD